MWVARPEGEVIVMFGRDIGDLRKIRRVLGVVAVEDLTEMVR